MMFWTRGAAAFAVDSQCNEKFYHSMKTILWLVSSLLVLTGCSTTRSGAAKGDPETVLVTYRVRAGKEAEFRELLARAWEIYRRDHLVFSEPHVVVQDNEEQGKPRFVEIFTWVSRSIPENAPDSVKAIWKQEESLCERRGEHYGIEPGEVKLIVPSRR
jgi:hypothetical protein